MKKALYLFLAIMAVGFLAACTGGNTEVYPAEIDDPIENTSPIVPEYNVIDTDIYQKDGVTVVEYRVEIGDGATEADMRTVYGWYYF